MNTSLSVRNLRPTLPLLSLTLLLVASACRRSPVSSGDVAHDHGHDHDHPGVVVRSTAYSERHEAFTEFPPPVAGQDTPFVVHITDLAVPAPRTAGEIVLQFRQGTVNLSFTNAAPARDGIYLSPVRFPSAGEWQGTLRIPGDGAPDAVSLGTIPVHASETDASRVVQPADTGDISFTKERQWKLRTVTTPVIRTNIVDRVPAAGTVTAPPGTMAVVSTPVAGILRAPADRRMPGLGDRVTAGQVLARVVPSFSEATAKLGETEGDIARARLSVAQAQRELDRVRRLVDSGVQSRQDLELAQLAADSAQAQLTAMLATRTSYREDDPASGELPAQDLKAPITGVIVTAGGDAAGQYVAADHSLFSILEPGHVRIEARVPEAAAADLGPSPGALAEFPARRGGFVPLTTGGGRLVFASPLVDAATHSVLFVFDVPDPEGRFRIGEHLTVHLESGTPEDAVVIPESAIVEDGGQPVAYVQMSGETFQRRELILGIRDGNRVQVRSGVVPGERVVSAGTSFVRLAGLSPSEPSHGHIH